MDRNLKNYYFKKQTENGVITFSLLPIREKKQTVANTHEIDILFHSPFGYSEDDMKKKAKRKLKTN